LRWSASTIAVQLALASNKTRTQDIRRLISRGCWHTSRAPQTALAPAIHDLSTIWINHALSFSEGITHETRLRLARVNAAVLEMAVHDLDHE
jgi:hypothetical protein